MESFGYLDTLPCRPRGAFLNLAMVAPFCRCRGADTQTTEQSVRLIQTAQTVEQMAVSPGGYPLALD